MTASSTGDFYPELTTTSACNVTVGGAGIATTGYCYTSPTYWYGQSDKGRQAFELVKGLMEKKFIEVKTAKQFIEAMETVMQVL